MKKRKKRKPFMLVIAIIAVIWGVLGAVDFFRVSRFERPLFCFSRESVYKGAEDYKHYQGIGYSFEIAANPLESEFPGVTRYTYFLFGKEIRSGIRE